MKNFNFKRGSTIFLLFFALSVFGQTNEATLHLPSNFTETYNNNGNVIHSYNHSITRTSQGNINEISATLEFIYDSEMYSLPSSVVVINEDLEYYNIVNVNNSSSVSISLPAQGNYDVIANFRSLDNNLFYYIIKELQPMQNNSTITIDVNQSNNYMSADLNNENGQLMRPGILNPDTGEVSGGNSSMFFEQMIYFKPFESIALGTVFTWSAALSEQESPMWNFYMNDVSNRYNIVQNLIAHGNNETFYLHKFPTLNGISDPISFTNTASNWTLHFEKFQQTPLGESSGQVSPAVTVLNTFGGKSLFTFGLVRFSNSFDPLNNGVKMYLNNPILENDESVLLAFPTIIDYRAIVDGWESPFFTEGNAVVSNGNGSVNYGSGNTTFSYDFIGLDFYALEDSYDYAGMYPFHPQFSYSSSENSNIVQGANVPIFIQGKSSGNKIKNQYKGRYGEVRETDYFNVQVEAKQNGVIIFTGDYFDFVAFELPSSGQIEIKYLNTNVKINDVIGKNEAKITYNADASDNSPPTIQHLQFRTSFNQVTDSFISASDGKVRLAAGDFQFNEINEWGDGYYSYNEGNEVEFYYSLKDQNSWTELDLTEYPEYFQEPAFGKYYEASLTSIENAESNAWYDIKIICTDAAGNKQEQIVSPAFKINETMATEEFTKSKFNVYPNPFSDNLNIQLKEAMKGNFIFRISDLTGKIVYTKEQTNKSFTWNGSSLPKGVYIFSIENNGKIIAKKVIKK